MQPFFSYYGSKNNGAKRYGPPRRDLVIEPFAGSAAYSVWWDCKRVRLYDLSEDVCAAWHWLIHCSDDDVRRLPDKLYCNAELHALPDGAKQVVFWNVGFAQQAFYPGLKKWYLNYTNKGIKPDNKARFWRESIKELIIRQKPRIRDWTIDCLHYNKVPIEDEAHWHVDPPYQGYPGRLYKHSSKKIDYAHLAEWCRSLPGAVDVCEQYGADWLPFRPLYKMPAASVIKCGSNERKRSEEVVWRNEVVDLLDLLGDEK